ncbi:1-phosphofructokinase [Gluconacetobacter takamatsuzukensis]|uniref:Phosphofructokinase n=1 Tax=Gluconacetobacter takamatsuzukensis TaxID=1286190 RepID=A0A7W4PPD4_9PROT|nr:1-phosphofructokinase [Gluconacetobacter takamatsuzukensis]MBB2205103.1 1-phosphofructokinase [Gluconacetobacter takamatsuzukensis]
MRVATVTFNPAIDQTVTVDHLVPGEVHRARAVRQNAGGKGVNVASCLADWGTRVTAFGLLGRENAGLFEALCAEKGIADRFRRIAGATRVNLKIVDDRDTTDINMDGAAVDAATLAEQVGMVEAFAGEDSLIVLSGSLPPGCPPGLYADLIGRLRARGARVLLDTSGLPLMLALQGSTPPSIVKPNLRELADWAGERVETTEDALRVATRLAARGVELVVVSMGAEGALFVRDSVAITARLRAGSVTSTVGAGDAMVAGLVAALAEEAALEDIARLSTAFAVGKLGLAGPNLPDRATIRALMGQVTIATAGRTEAGGAGETA